VRKESGCKARCSCGFEQGYEEPICAVSDLPATEAKTAWYQLRFWIEDEYKDGKRGWFHWEHTKMTKPERASRLWLVLAIAMQKAVLLGGELEAQEQEAQRKQHRRLPGKKRRPGRPALPQKRPRGREQSVIMRGIMAMRAVETGGKKILPQGRVRAEPLPTRLYAVSRVPKSYQLKKQRREEKKRQRQRARTKVKREQRAEAKASQQAEKLARRQEKQARREAKQAAELARQQERQGRRAAKEARLLAHRPAKPATQQSHQAPSSVLQKPWGNPVGHRPLRERCAERSLPPASDDHQQGSVRSPVSDMQPGGRPFHG
jgi:hypothetical protein